MKIIQGKHKGTILKGFEIDGTRPTMDRVKESLFAMIQNNIADSTVLDLFAGSGNLGIEALSMGAKECYFVDKNSIACKTIKENLDKVREFGTILKSDYNDALNSFKNKFDIIFLDPPYNTDYINKSLELISKNNLLADSGIVICESNDINRISYDNYFTSFKERKYGKKIVVILKKNI